MADTLTGRLNFRLAADQERALRQAASITGQSVSGFVLSSAVEHAQEILERANHIMLSAIEFERFVNELAKPAEVVPELVALARRHRQIPAS